MTQEPKSRSPRIEIEPRVWPALQVEAITRRMSPKDLVNMLIMEALSPKAREFMEPLESKPHDPMIPHTHDTAIPETIATEKPMIPPLTEGTAIKSREISGPEKSQKRKRLFENPDALQQIKTLWAEGVHNGTEIAKRIDYPKATVAEHIKQMKARGELAD